MNHDIRPSAFVTLAGENVVGALNASISNSTLEDDSRFLLELARDLLANCDVVSRMMAAMLCLKTARSHAKDKAPFNLSIDALNALSNAMKIEAAEIRFANVNTHGVN